MVLSFEREVVPATRQEKKEEDEESGLRFGRSGKRGSGVAQYQNIGFAWYGVTDAAGKFSYPVQKGNYTVKVVPPASALMALSTFSRRITADAAKNISLPKGYKLWGTVKDAAHISLSGVLSVFQKTNPYVKGMIITEFLVLNGRYTGYLPAGSYTLVFLPYPPANTGYKGKAAKTSFDLTMPAADKSLNLVAQNGVILSGQVRDANNAIVKSADVGVIVKGAATSSKPSDRLWYITATDAKGQDRLPLPKATYELYAMPLHQSAASSPLEAWRANVIKAVWGLGRLSRR